MGNLVQYNSDSALPTIIGEKQIRVPVGGKIRPGIKALTRAAKENPKAAKLYNEGVAAGRSFDEIEKQIVEQCNLKNPLTPRNVPYFTARRGDFVVPEVADRLLDLYGEDRDNGYGRQLYSFPVVFAFDAWQAVMPHSLRCYTSSELKFWSEYSPDGNRMCKTHAPVEIDPRSKRAVRKFGGRDIVNRGMCDPEKCPEYQARKCNLTGSLLFYVPGVPGTSLVELPTNSFYAMQNARQKLEMVSFMRGGRIAGMFNGQPIFYITKKMHEVSRIDPETGQPGRVKQWLIELEANIEMALAFNTERIEDHNNASEAAVHVLQGGESQDVASDAPEEYIEAETPEQQDAVNMAEQSAPPPQGEAVGLEVVKALRQKLAETLASLGIDAMAYKTYGDKKFGAGWSADASALNEAISEAQGIGQQYPDAYREEIVAASAAKAAA